MLLLRGLIAAVFHEVIRKHIQTLQKALPLVFLGEEKHEVAEFLDIDLVGALKTKFLR